MLFTSFILLFQQDVPLFTADGSMFYTILAAKQGARGEFHHIAGLSAQVGQTLRPLHPQVDPRFVSGVLRGR